MSRDEPRDVGVRYTCPRAVAYQLATRRAEAKTITTPPLHFPVNMVSLYLTPFGPL